MSAFPPPSHHDEVEQTFASELVQNATLEITSASVAELDQARDLLPLGTKIFLPDHAAACAEDKLESIATVKRFGFDPVPHIVLNRWHNTSDLRDFLAEATSEYGVHRVHLLGSSSGNPQDAERTTRLIEAQTLVEANVRAITVRGYPEGNPGSDPSFNERELAQRMELAQRQGLGIDIVTQYSFAPSRTLEFCSRLERVAPHINQYIAIAGPSTQDELEQYAQTHNISSALRGLDRFGAKAVSEHCHPSADEQLHFFARHCATLGPGNIIGVHLLCTGGLLSGVRWLNRYFS